MTAKNRGAGSLRERLHFQQRETGQDGYGNEQPGEWKTIFSAAAEAIPLRGTEAVMAERLSGVQPFVFRLRSSKNSRAVDATWRAVDARNSKRVFNIKTNIDPDSRNAWRDMTMIEGEAT